MGRWLEGAKLLPLITDIPPVAQPLRGLELLWEAATGPIGQGIANEAYKVVRSLGLAPFSIGLILMSAINKSLKEMDDFHKPAYNGPRTSWDPFNSMNYITGDESEWDPMTTTAILGENSTWDPVLWSNGGEGFPAAWNPVEVLA